jgi:hypothetical protein
MPAIVAKDPRVGQTRIVLALPAKKDLTATEQDRFATRRIPHKGRKRARRWTSSIQRAPSTTIPGPRIIAHGGRISATEEHRDLPTLVVHHDMGIAHARASVRSAASRK